MALAALEAGICINNSSVTIVHGMSRPVGALFHVPHGLSNAMLLTVCLRDVMDGALDRFASLSHAAGCAADLSDATAADAPRRARGRLPRLRGAGPGVLWHRPGGVFRGG